MALVNIVNPFAQSPYASANPQIYAKATTLGLLSKPPGPIVTNTQGPSTPVSPLMQAPSMSTPSTSLTRGAKVPPPSTKQLGPATPGPTAALKTSPYKLPNGQMDEPDAPGAPDEDESVHSKRRKRTSKGNSLNMGLVMHPEDKTPRPSPNNLAYSQSYDPEGRGYRPLSSNTFPQQTVAALRAKFKTPSNLG